MSQVRGWIASLAVAAALGGVGSLSAQQAAPAVDSSWLHFDAAAKRVEFDLLAGMTNAFAGLNFNGFRSGALTLTVPAGWTVTLHFKNRDPNLPHSAEVAPGGDIPSGPVKPAFTGAATRALDTGLQPGEGQDITFSVAKAGSYMIICPVPGHAAAGMWIRLVVSATASSPTLTASAAS
jgi:sulfocyanin